jgi:ferredoxin--NADP+ reductase
LRVAVVGSGPSGFYAAAQLLACEQPEFSVDLFDRLPTPFGLVRAGVAPDHPKIKSVTKAFERTAQHDRLRFHGGVELGTDITRDQLRASYDAVVYAIGSATDRRLGIAGEELAGSHAATDFVAWYNGHPDYCELEFDLLRARRVVVVGNGNVAIDVARMLALDEDELEVTDTAEHAIEVLSRSAIEEVVIVGRRGPAQAAFTNPELREMGELKRADVFVDPAELELDPASGEWLASDEAPRTNRLNIEILHGYAARVSRGMPMHVRFSFLRSPVGILGDDMGRVRAIRLERNELVEGRPRGTGMVEELPCELIFRSIGYLGRPVAGVPFDHARGVIRNDAGRVIDDDGVCPGEYVTGWIKRGPSGVIGTNKKDSQDTVDKLIADAREGLLPEPSRCDIDDLLSDVDHRVSWEAWQAIDHVERASGEPSGRPRVKLVTWEALREAARDIATARPSNP